MIEILLEYRAVIDEIMGDGILAFFGAPESPGRSSLAAVACAMEMQAAMDEINFFNEADGLPHLEYGLRGEYRGGGVGNIGSSAAPSTVWWGLTSTSPAASNPLPWGAGAHHAATYSGEGAGAGRRRPSGGNEGDSGEVHPLRDPGHCGPYNIQLKDRREALVQLTEPVNVHLHASGKGWSLAVTRRCAHTHLSETAVQAP